MAAAVFFLSAAFVIYILFGYPLLLAALATRRPRPVRKAPNRQSVSLILPVRDGESWIDAKLQTISELRYPRELLEVIVVLDGSTDGTAGLARRFENVRLLAIPPTGKGGALNAGIRQASGDILFFTDVRQTLDPMSLANLVENFADPEVGVASGELIIREGANHEQVNTGLYWKYEKWIRRRLSALDSVPGATGAIYAMRRELAVPFPPHTLLDDMFLPLAAFFQGYRVIFDETARAYDHPIALRGEFRRKVRTLAGNFQILTQYPQLLGPTNRIWIHYMSHKLGRLLLPWALLAILLTGFCLPAPWSAPVVSAQLAFYGVAAADLAIPESSRWKRLSSPVRTFVVLMAASFCAASFFFRSSGSIWKETRIANAETPSSASDDAVPK